MITRRALGRSGDAKLDAMAGLELFAGVRRRELCELARVFELSSARPGQVLQRLGERPRWWHLIVAGTATVDHGSSPSGLLGAGGSWGERSLLLAQESPVTVVALSEVSLLAIDRRRLVALWDGDSAFASRLFARFMGAPSELPDLIVPALLVGI